MVSKLNLQTYTSEFESHWVPHSYDLVLRLSKNLRKLLLPVQGAGVKFGMTFKTFFSLISPIKNAINQNFHD